MGPSSSVIHADITPDPISASELRDLIYDTIAASNVFNQHTVLDVEEFIKGVVSRAKERRMILSD